MDDVFYFSTFGHGVRGLLPDHSLLVFDAPSYLNFPELRKATLTYIHFVEEPSEGKAKVDILFRILQEQLPDDDFIKV